MRAQRIGVVGAGVLGSEIARGRLSPEEAAAILDRIVAADADEALAGCDVIIEATTLGGGWETGPLAWDQGRAR